MKSKISNLTGRIAIVSILSILTFSSCAIRKEFQLSPVVPAARGYVKIDTDRNKNYNIKIHVENLAEAERLAGRNSVYVAWMDTRDNEIRNLGQIKSSTGMFSKSLKASLETKSSFKPNRIFLTAEDDANVQFPRSETVLSTDRF